MMRQRVAAAIIKNNQILLMHRIKNGRDYFTFPGGGAEPGETLEQTLVREIKEELNLDIMSTKLFFEFLNTEYQNQEHYYLVEDFSGEPKLGGEEKDRMNKDNQYYPIWKNLREIKDLNNLYPQEAKEKVIELYGHN